MKKAVIIGSILAATLTVAHFDALVIFLLSGFIPGINVTLTPSKMLAVIAASTLLVAALRHRHAVYQHSLELYDEYIAPSPEKMTPRESIDAKRPRRRYQEL